MGVDTVLNIKGKQVEVDIKQELQEYDFGHKLKITPSKLIAPSPFRIDRKPSFFINISGEYAGTWADSGSTDEEYSRGNFVKLIALLRGISYEEASDYLLEKYGILYEIKPNEPIRLPAPKIKTMHRNTYIEDNPIIEATSPYLLSRGISAEVQAKFKIGYDEAQPGFTAIPWHFGGRLANIMYRSTRGKYFFYHAGGNSIKRLLFGIDQAEEYSVIVEGVIDAMSWREAGYAAIAIGGAHMSREQAEIIKRSKIKRLYLGGDNDEQGRKLNAQVAEELRGYVELYSIDYGEYKDANEVLTKVINPMEELTTMVKHGNRLQLCNIAVT